jgi:hypothetical protein
MCAGAAQQRNRRNEGTCTAVGRNWLWASDLPREGALLHVTPPKAILRFCSLLRTASVVPQAITIAAIFEARHMAKCWQATQSGIEPPRVPLTIRMPWGA